MIIVSGCPRSGTSLMMDTLRTALGDDRILGAKFPQEHTPKKGPNESSSRFAARKYVLDKHKKSRNKQQEKTKDMNPNGFFECRYSVGGVLWHLGIEDICTPEKVCKVVSQGLIHTDPKWVDKIIYMIRHPKAVATSQEQLKRSNLPLDDLGVVHTPKMFVDTTYKAAVWLKKYSNIPIIIIDFDDLISDPDNVLSNVQEFVGEGDFSSHPVDKTLRRSKYKDIPSLLWDMAESMYEAMSKQDYDSVIKTFESNNGSIIRDSGRHACARLGRRVSYRECLNCYNNKKVAANFRLNAEKRGIVWREEPCLFECGFSCEEGFDHKTIEESISENHWEDF